MGNCQAAEAATVVIEHPGGRVERLYWATAAAEVMRSNPGHHVALVTLCRAEERSDGGGGSVRVTRVKLLKPKDLLLIGQVYRLITTQEVTRALKARKYEKMKKAQSEQQQQQQQNRRVVVDEQAVEFNGGGGGGEIDSRNYDQVAMHERDRQQGVVAAQSAARSRQWRPSLQSISEAAS